MSNVLNGNVSETGLLKGSISGTGTLKGGLQAILGKDGYSAYEIAVKNGFEGTEAEWLASLKGEDGSFAFDELTPEQLESIKGKDGTDGKDGKDGKDGVSATHAWNGTVLTVTSASGTSSADLKGERGEKGETGSAGRDGIDGKDGTSVTVKNISQSTADGGYSFVTFSDDNKTVAIKNGNTGAAGKDGIDGKDGVSPVVSVSKVGKVTTITITDANGTKTATIFDGEDGVGGGSSGGGTGADGEDGVGIASIVQTTKSTADDGINVITITLTDGSQHTFEIQNGSKGSTGASGSNGKDGTSVSVKSVSESTADGGSNVVTFSDGKTVTIKNGSKGSTGAAGKDGKDGNPGVYVGTGDMPDGYILQINPEGNSNSFRDSIIAEVLALARESANVRIGEVDLPANGWNGTVSPYWQEVSIPTVTANTQVDLTPSVDQLAVFHHKDLAFVTENDGGIVTVYAVGQKPENDYTIQVTMTEVIV